MGDCRSSLRGDRGTAVGGVGSSGARGVPAADRAAARLATAAARVVRSLTAPTHWNTQHHTHRHPEAHVHGRHTVPARNGSGPRFEQNGVLRRHHTAGNRPHPSPFPARGGYFAGLPPPGRSGLTSGRWPAIERGGVRPSASWRRASVGPAESRATCRQAPTGRACGASGGSPGGARGSAVRRRTVMPVSHTIAARLVEARAKVALVARSPAAAMSTETSPRPLPSRRTTRAWVRGGSHREPRLPDGSPVAKIGGHRDLRSDLLVTCRERPHVRPCRV
jgi:hypothetical protein